MRTRPVRWTRTRSGPWATASHTAVVTPGCSTPAEPKSICSGKSPPPSRGWELQTTMGWSPRPLEGEETLPARIERGAAGFDHDGVGTAVGDAVAHGPERVRVHRTGRVRIYHACDATHDR